LKITYKKNNKKTTTSIIIKARIKKIMQMDEEVGKVSSAVPVMVCILLKIKLIDETV
jgi:hypothetical protein